MTNRLEGRVAIVNGAGSSGPGWGNGKCTAIQFAREGAKVVVVDINKAAAEETAGLIAHVAADGDGVVALAEVHRPVVAADVAVAEQTRPAPVQLVAVRVGIVHQLADVA